MIPTKSFLATSKFGSSNSLIISNSIASSHNIANSGNVAPSAKIDSSESAVKSKGFIETAKIVESGHFEFTDRVGGTGGIAASIIVPSDAFALSAPLTGSQGLIASASYIESNNFERTSTIKSPAGFAGSVDPQATVNLKASDSAVTLAVGVSTLIPESDINPQSSGLVSSGDWPVSVVIGASQSYQSSLILPSAGVGGTPNFIISRSVIDSSQFGATSAMGITLNLAVSINPPPSARLIASNSQDTVAMIASAVIHPTPILQNSVRLLISPGPVSDSFPASHQFDTSKSFAKSAFGASSLFAGTKNHIQSQSRIESNLPQVSGGFDRSSGFAFSSALPKSVGFAVSSHLEGTRSFITAGVDVSVLHIPSAQLKSSQSDVISVAPHGSAIIAATGLVSSNQFGASSHVGVTALIDNSNQIPNSKALESSFTPNPTNQFGHSNQLLESDTVVSIAVLESGSLIISGGFDRSSGFAFSSALQKSVGFDVSSHLDGTRSFITTRVDVSVLHIPSAQVKSSKSYEISKDFQVSVQVNASSRPAESGGFVSQDVPISSPVQPSIAVIATAAVVGSNLIAGTPSFLTDQLGNSLTPDPSHNFVGSDVFTASAFSPIDGAARQSGVTPTQIGSIAASALALVALAVVTILFIKRRNRDLTDAPMEYETEGNAIDLSESDSMEENSDEWDADVFDRAIASAFDQPTNLAQQTSEQLFPSDCDEIF
jgi:hypothetical protein